MTVDATVEAKYADKIMKLLAQAENSGATEEERDAFREKAMKLMLEYQIDEAMIAAARGLTVDELVQDVFNYEGIYRNGTRNIGTTVADHFGLRCVYGRDTYSRPIRLPLHLTGFRSDVERARLLDTSLQLQCSLAMRDWAKTVDFSWMDKGTAFRSRRDFVFGFASGVSSQLAAAKRTARAEAAQREAERSEVAVTEAKASVDLVLVGRKERVDEYYDTVWGGRTRASRRGGYSSGAAGGRNAGFSAGLQANTNAASGRIGGTRGAIGR